MAQDIQVEKDGRRANIPLQCWAIMPEGKYGWAPVRAELPAAVSHSIAATAEKVKTPRQKRKKQ